ncbi:MAG: sulfatase-like hydrolase/transferase [Candidatus Magasanikbacteria bacterium]|nr:sulfatase-like hydrolase/transferase [Candidatus Magasanikbacteria bacterium]
MFARLKIWWSKIQTLAAAFIISAGWNWYHTPYRPHSRFVFISIATWAAVFIGYQVFKWLYHFFTAKFNRHIFWQKEFSRFLDSLFFLFSLFFLIFFSRYQLLSIFSFLFLMSLFFYKTQTYLSHHPGAREWKLVNRNIFTVVFFLFTLFSVFQYTAYRFANFDSYLKFHNIVLFRAWAMTMFWVLGFVVATLIYWKIKTPFLRYAALGLWAIFFIFLLVFWSINIGIMYFTGLYFSPLMLAVAGGAPGLAFNWITIIVVAGNLSALIIFSLIFYQVIKSFQTSAFRQWVYYSLALIAIALFSLFGLSSFQNTPEYTIARNFYNYFLVDKTEVKLSPAIKEKMERFGLFYNIDEFYLAHKDKVFTANKTFLPEKFNTTKPNVIIIFFESFSSRLTSVYNKNLTGLTPGLEQMANDSSTVIFKNYFNASTPTINGIIAQMCSFLPPTGYTEVEDNKNLQRLRLLCLPTILKNNGYKSATYITAVPKEFENKNAIFKSMDMDGIYGQEELKKIITGEPLSWGYSDHQLYPAMWKMLNEKNQEPFLMMLSTVDTHAPFNLAKDMVLYKDGKNDVLNSYHTADDAFGRFWQEFKQSPHYSNTIVVAVADHAVFPGRDIKDLFPADAKSLSFYDENMLMIYLPGITTTVIPATAGIQATNNLISNQVGNDKNKTMPKEVNLFSSSIDITPTILQILNINTANGFEGHSLFDDKNKYQNILGMHEYGLYINQEVGGSRNISYEIPSELRCGKEEGIAASTSLTLCEYLGFYRWKRQMFEQGRFWGK